ncbi:MAG: carbon storage regulator [Planctomycetes bacterium]|nr:carbon storage regulator [Planctomycetota bacterium]
MLVLTRKENEAIVIRDQFGAEIRLSVKAISGNKVRLGIEAPSDVRILREEVAQMSELSAESACL